jgi:hypothetical protein
VRGWQQPALTQAARPVTTGALKRTTDSPNSSSGRDIRLALFCDSFLPQINGVSLLLARLGETATRLPK